MDDFFGEHSKTAIDYLQSDKKNGNYKGAAISGVRLDAYKAYSQIPNLLETFINEHNDLAWRKIAAKIDYIYTNLHYTLGRLDEETDFGREVQAQIRAGKKLFFKPNLVCPSVINETTHIEGTGASICTEWPLVAAIMRWFHDKLHINYSEMAIGDASTTAFALSYSYSKAAGRAITTEAVVEGKSEDFYGGWGFFFVRKYLKEHHPASHIDDPMNGYEDSISGRYFPPGKAGNRLMVYDLNKLDDDITKGRTISVPGGANYKKITLHKVIIGGDPLDYQDLKNYPGCVLVNIPKLKLHAQDLLTNAIKNLGIGLYPSQCSLKNSKGDTELKYAYASASIPIWKGKLPHSPWILKIDDDTGLPLKDKYGKYIATKTDGFSGTQVDVIKAVQHQNIFMLHIVDAINMINISHDPDGWAVRIPEGYIWSSLDCVALDLFCSRYCFKTLPMHKALRLAAENFWPTEFVRHTPIAKITGNNISSTTGLDSPLFRYKLYQYAQERGIGQQKYYVVGWDGLTHTPLASVKGHLGRMDAGIFQELMTQTMYYNRSTILHDLQKTVLSYLKACDTLAGSTLVKEFMNTFDENKDGVIDYDEKGRGIETFLFWMLAHSTDMQLTTAYGTLRKNFYEPTFFVKNANKNWNIESNDFTKERVMVQKVELAYRLSLSEDVTPDLFMPRMTFGRGMWPSWQTVTYIYMTNTIYGTQYSNNITLDSLYGSAFQYADKVLSAGAYTGSIDETTSASDCINKYFEAVSKGAELLNFTLYVPVGYGNLEQFNIPNIQETKDPQKIFTVFFSNIW